MTFVDKTLDEMLKEIGFNEFGTYDIIIPEKNGRTNLLNPDTSEEFDENMSRLIKEKTGNHNAHYIVDETILNALWWGNKKQIDMPISVKTFFGDKGIVFRIRDSGKGFDFKETIRKLGNREKYYNNYGGGFIIQQSSPYDISYEGDGSIVNICILHREEGWKKYLTKKE